MSIEEYLSMDAILSADSSKTQRVYDFIDGEIRAGVLSPGVRMQGMRDLAKKFDVSVAVINSVYNTLEAKGMIVRFPRSGAIINPRLKPAKTKLMALITSFSRQNIENYYEPFFEATSNERIISVVGVIDDRKDWHQIVGDIIARHPDSLLIDVEAKQFPLDELKHITFGIPVCYCNRWEWFPENPVRAVLTDYAGAYGEALVFLRRCGHRRIILVNHHSCPEPFLNKHIETAMKFAGLTFGEEVLRISEEQLINDPVAVETLIVKFHATALFGLSDYLVHEIVEKCPRAKGLEKLGFFDLWHSRVPRREFNSFNIDFGEIWKEAIKSFDSNNAQVRHVNPKLILK